MGEKVCKYKKLREKVCTRERVEFVDTVNHMSNVKFQI